MYGIFWELGSRSSCVAYISMLVLCKRRMLRDLKKILCVTFHSLLYVGLFLTFNIMQYIFFFKSTFEISFQVIICTFFRFLNNLFKDFNGEWYWNIFHAKLYWYWYRMLTSIFMLFRLGIHLLWIVWWFLLKKLALDLAWQWRRVIVKIFHITSNSTVCSITYSG